MMLFLLQQPIYQMLWDYNDFVLIVVTAIAAVYDIKTRSIPNKLILPAVFAGLLINVITRRFDNLIVGIISFGVLLVIYTAREQLIGGGDVKLIIFMALLLGQDITEVITITVIYTVFVWIYFYVKEKKSKVKQIVPLALPLFLAAVTHLIGGNIL